MVNEHVDIANVLSIRAGKHLAEAYAFHQEMSKQKLPQEQYFQLRSQERDACIEAVILFQAGMEAIINEELETEKKLLSIKLENDNLNKKFKMLSFKNKWLKSFEILKMSSADLEFLDNYLKFYLKFRVPITHAKNRVVDAEHFNFPNVYEGVKTGYVTIELFYRKLEKFEAEHTWQQYIKICLLPNI